MKVGDNIHSENGNWKFSGKTVDNFDSHVSKSVPLYNEGHDLICKLSDYFIQDNSVVYEIGTSTGELLLKLAKYHKNRPSIKFIGIDVEEDMITKAKIKRDKLSLQNVDFIIGSAVDVDYEPADLFLSYYTMQFIRPSERQLMLDLIYKNLRWGGALAMFEKVRAPDARFQDIMTGVYSEYKLDQGYEPEEIVAKTRSLKGVLEPFSTQGNLDLMERSGFVDIMSIQKMICFEGFLAIK